MKARRDPLPTDGKESLTYLTLNASEKLLNN